MIKGFLITALLPVEGKIKTITKQRSDIIRRNIPFDVTFVKSRYIPPAIERLLTSLIQPGMLPINSWVRWFMPLLLFGQWCCPCYGIYQFTFRVNLCYVVNQLVYPCWVNARQSELITAESRVPVRKKKLPGQDSRYYFPTRRKRVSQWRQQRKNPRQGYTREHSAADVYANKIEVTTALPSFIVLKTGGFVTVKWILQ